MPEEDLKVFSKLWFMNVLILSATDPSVRQSVSLLMMCTVLVEMDTLLLRLEVDLEEECCFGGKMGGLRLSVDKNRPLGGNAGAPVLELWSEPSSMDRRLSVLADLAFLRSCQCMTLDFSMLAFSISFWNF